MNVFSLSPLKLIRPKLIRWNFPSSTQDELSLIKSKSLRGFLRNVETSLTENQIQTEMTELTEAQFSEWLVYYERIMTENNYEILANKADYQEKTKQGGKVLGLFFKKAGVLVGSGIIFLDADRSKAVFAYKASDRIVLSGDANSSLGAVIDYFFIKKMRELKVPHISAGRSRNAFGVINTLGYLDYKLRFGYLPEPGEETAMLDTVPVNEQGVVLFYGIKDDKLGLYALKPAGYTGSFEQKRFATPELPFVEIEYNPDDLLK